MEYYGNNYNINSSGLHSFIGDIITKISSNDKAPEILLGDTLMLDDLWLNIAADLSKIEGCKKIIKTEYKSTNTILFISEDISTKYVKNVMTQYCDILFDIEEYFELFVLNDSEFIQWENNENNVVYWEK